MFIKDIPALKKKLLTPSLRMVICIPSGITEVEMRAVKESAERVMEKKYILFMNPWQQPLVSVLTSCNPKGT